MRHVYECPMRWADMDVLGHVNNVTYVDYLQEARVDMFALHEGPPSTEPRAEGLVVARNDIEFVRPLMLRAAPIRIEMWVSRVRAASFTLAYEIVDEVDGERVVYTRAWSDLTPFLFAEERPRRITDDEREFLTRYLEEPVA
ncbi:acyl-CoA thioesterase [Solicola sp. PLA-1-18]|uniref:acyl-CoA thioesterase n=1 Tax=Solicola sp. PLA-1-18 TaxID=3380532 RepID=UPI003B80E182